MNRGKSCCELANSFRSQMLNPSAGLQSVTEAGWTVSNPDVTACPERTSASTRDQPSAFCSPVSCDSSDQKRAMRWTNSSDQRRHARHKCTSRFIQRDESSRHAAQTNSVMGTELRRTKEFWEEEALFLTSPSICPRPRGNILPLALSGGFWEEEKKLMSCTSRWQRKEREE